MKLIATTIAGLVFLLCGSADAAPKYTPRVSLEAARAAALERVPGKLVEEELEHEKGRWIYEFEIKPTGETGNRVKEVAVDPETGKVLAVEDEVEDGAEGQDDDDAKDDDDDDRNEQARNKAKGGKGKPAKKQRHTARR